MNSTTATPGPAAPANSTATSSPNPMAQPTAAAAHEGAPDSNPYATATRHPWTQADVDRVRAQLAAEHAAQGVQQSESRAPVVHGDAGAAFAFGLEVDAIFHNDAGFQLFNEANADARLGFWGGYDLATLSKQVILSGELGFGVESISGSNLFGTDAHAQLVTQTYQGSLTARWEALSFLAPHVRLSGGVSRVDLRLVVDDHNDAHNWQVSGFGALGGGFLLHTPARTFETRSGKLASLTLGILLEAGYALRSPVDFALHTVSAPHAIPIVDANLGRLELSGAYIRTSLVVRF